MPNTVSPEKQNVIPPRNPTMEQAVAIISNLLTALSLSSVNFSQAYNAATEGDQVAAVKSAWEGRTFTQNIIASISDDIRRVGFDDSIFEQVRSALTEVMEQMAEGASVVEAAAEMDQGEANAHDSE